MIKTLAKKLLPAPTLKVINTCLDHVLPSRRRHFMWTEKRRGRRQQRRIVRRYKREHGPVVGTGPFAGMLLLPRYSRGELAACYIGSYEQEIHPLIERVISRAPRRVINVGCADGYYCIGLARRLHDTEVFGFDTNELARELVPKLARLNSVEERVFVGGLCTPSALQALVHEETLVLVDCEGCEQELLDPQEAPVLERATILVELHDFVDPTITKTVRNRFADTHSIEVVGVTDRDPNRYPFVLRLSQRDRAAALEEFRPTEPHPIQWALLEPLAR